ncbi:hypothetical protein [Streptomyces sp. NPDC058718]|uniref:hypothetical protein n=1 Tax=Streptomyces sp. NPDC058718 TaxID=3346610 RepID=UPI003686FF09
MNRFTRLGNALLDRLAPEAVASASEPCSQGCAGSSRPFKETRCYGPKMYVRCCSTYEDCTPWQYCGLQCA